MSLYCKSCGSEIEIIDGQKTAVCGFCGMEQTVPTPDDPQKMELFVKANEYRIACRFDIAKKQYESIIAQYPDDNEAYWCKLLSVYGIEYVDDDLTEKKLPTCHRTVTESIFDNSDYKLIMSRATAEERAIYEAEAKEIDRIQKEILAKANNEEPFDIFICYKETELNSGKRTIDAQHATKIYTYLTEHGYKVFFSRITLKNKLGSEYEPIIYSALKSAKVMLHVSTSVEHTNAPWVRNEWSRFLEFMNGDVTKIILPCIAQMGPYELPDELGRFQVADMTDLDFYENLLLQINKKFGRYVERKKEEPVTVTQTRTEENATQTTNNSNIQPLLKRINIFLLSNDWDKADEYAEKVLDIDPECSEAYLGKLLAEKKIQNKEQLKDCEKPFDNSKTYQMLMMFANETLKQEINGYIDYVKERNENARKQGIYDKATSLMLGAKTESGYKEAGKTFESIKGYKDAQALADECYEKAEEARKNAIYAQAKGEAKGDNISDYESAIAVYKTIIDWKDSREQIEYCSKRIVEIKEKQEAERKNSIYTQAKEKAKGDNISKYESAIDLYKSIIDWKDSREQIEYCEKRIVEIKAKNEAERLAREAERKNTIYAQAKGKAEGDNISDYQSAIGLYKSIIDWKDSREQIEYCEKRIADIKAKREAERLAREEERKLKEKCEELVKTLAVAKREAERKRCEELVKSLDSAISKGEIEKIRKQAQEELKRLSKEAKELVEIKEKLPIIQPQIVAIENELKELESRISALILEKSKLGFFAMKRKKEINAEIKGIESNKKEKEINKDNLNKELNGYTSITAIEKDVEKYGQQIEEAKARVEESKALLTKEEIIAKLKQSEIGVKLYESTDEYKKELINELSKAEVGTTIKFGKYYQSNATTKEDIEWQVLKTEGNRALLISKYALDCKPYNMVRKDVTWDTCTLRKWLNNEFINSAFSETEKAIIPTVLVSADKNPSYITNSGNATQDKVFLLSIPEANKYFSSDTARMCKPTAYAEKQGVYVDDNYGSCFWWLRSPGRYQNYASDVFYSGYVYYDGTSVRTDYRAVRPALWVNL